MLIRSLLPAVAAALLVAPAAVAQASAVPGKVIVRYEDDSTHVERLAALQNTGTQSAAEIAGGSRVLHIADGEGVRETLAELRQQDGVAYAVPEVRVRAAFVPKDPGRAGTPGGWRKLQWNFAGPNGVNAPAAWDLARRAEAPGGRGAVVAVIDSGVAYKDYKQFRRAPDLYASRYVRGYDWVDRDRHPLDQESHGTHVTGTIAQKTNNKKGLTGLAYGVKIMPLRVLDRNGNGVGSDIARAIRYAVRHGADVVNMSVEFDLSEKARNIPDVIKALRYAERKGVVMVAASGNEGRSKVAYPARASQVISVGATTSGGCLADYSNDGNGLDIVAPGGGSDAPAVDDNAYDATHCKENGGKARRIYQQTLWGDVRTFRLVGYEGTSFSTPHVSAAAALLIATGRLGKNPRPQAVRRRLMDTARDLGAPGYDSRYGAGLLDVAAALGP
jgi:serine protease